MVRKLGNDELADFESVEVQVIRIENLVLAGHPTELFSEYSLRMRESAAGYSVVPVGYAGGLVGYVPNPAAYQAGAYEADLVPRIFEKWGFRSDVGDILTTGVAEAVAIATER